MREIVLDTETTGIDPFTGDRIVEIGAVELINHVPTGRIYQQYINPERSMSEEVIAVHGLTEEFLSDKPKFSEIVDEFLDFIGSDSHLVIHNASFDMKFLNAELSWLGRDPIASERAIDTLAMARQKYPGGRASLNELCKKFDIDLSARTLHGALLDSQLLAEVYLEMIGGKQPGLVFQATEVEKKPKKSDTLSPIIREKREDRIFELCADDVEQHAEFIKKIKNNLWGIE